MARLSLQDRARAIRHLEAGVSAFRVAASSSVTLVRSKTNQEVDVQRRQHPKKTGTPQPLANVSHSKIAQCISCSTSLERSRVND